MVAVRCVWTATHQAEFLGIPATGRRIHVANSDFYRLRDGMFVEHWDIPDYMTIYRQLGGDVGNAPEMFAGSTEG